MRFSMKNVPLDPTSMFEGLVTGAPGGTCYDACCDWRADLGDSAFALVPARLQIVPILRGPDRRASGRSGDSAGREAGARPAGLTRNLMAIVMRCAMT